MVPKGWEVKTLNEVSKITRLAGAEYSDVWETNPHGEIIALRGYNIGNNHINLRDVERITQEMSLKLSRSKLFKDDIVFPCVGSIGKAYLVKEDNRFHINQNIAKLTPDETVDPLYLTYCLLSKESENQIMKFNTSSSQPNVLVGNLRKFEFQFPLSVLEQQKIAKILSTWDNAISTTERLIENSTQQKKALMQQLLTGKKRLLDESGKRFEGEWEEVKLEDICIINPRKSIMPEDGLVSFVPMEAVSEDAKLMRQEIKKYDDVSKGFTSFINEDVIVAKITPCFENGKGAFIDGLHNGIGFGSTEFHVLRAKKQNHARFIYYLSLTNDFRGRGQLNMQGSAGHKRVTTDYVKLYKFLVPPTYKEQQKIATVLTSADNEIEALEQQLAHLQKEKKALMQVLLTGKKRVVVD